MAEKDVRFMEMSLVTAVGDELIGLRIPYFCTALFCKKVLMIFSVSRLDIQQWGWEKYSLKENAAFRIMWFVTA
jgi:hypothetical protein